MPGYLDFLDLPELQQAQQQAMVVQHQQRLALPPRVNLAPLARQALEARRVQQQLSLGQQRLNLLAKQERSRRRQEPFAIGLGVADVGVNLLGGLRALQAQRQAAQGQARIEALREAELGERRELTKRLLDVQGLQRSLFQPPTTEERLFP